jgi:hypothetical protein
MCGLGLLSKHIHLAENEEEAEWVRKARERAKERYEDREELYAENTEGWPIQVWLGICPECGGFADRCTHVTNVCRVCGKFKDCEHCCISCGDKNCGRCAACIHKNQEGGCW